MATYKVEPYVIAADVYARAPHTGRGGWTWYTGSAGWMYRLIVEALLGVTIENGRLRIAPCLPADWPGFTMRYRYRGTTYEIVDAAVACRGTTRAFPRSRSRSTASRKAAARCRSSDDGQTHQVRVDIRTAAKSAA